MSATSRSGRSFLRNVSSGVSNRKWKLDISLRVSSSSMNSVSRCSAGKICACDALPKWLKYE